MIVYGIKEYVFSGSKVYVLPYVYRTMDRAKEKQKKLEKQAEKDLNRTVLCDIFTCEFVDYYMED